MTDQTQAPINFLGSLARIEAKPGDRFVLMCDRPVSDEERERFLEAWERFMGPDAPKIIILSDGIKIGVVGKDTSHANEEPTMHIVASKAGSARLIIDPDAPLGDVLRSIDGFEEWFNRIIAKGDHLTDRRPVKHPA